MSHSLVALKHKLDAVISVSRDAQLTQIPRKHVIDVSRLLAESGLRHAEWLPQLDSTNTRALQLAADPAIPTPFLIGSERQTAGRGRGGNLWWSGDGGLMFSIGVDMPSLGLATCDWPRFSLVTGLAIADTLSHFLPTSSIGLKWPNDVWVDGRKVCGILIEQADRAPDRLVVGIGINVNNSFAEAPDEIRKIGTSMIDAASGQSFCRTDVLHQFLTNWQSLTQRLSAGTINLPQRWSQLCVLMGHAVTVTMGPNQTTGICAGIEADGCLLLRTEFATERCYAGTVRLLNPHDPA